MSVVEFLSEDKRGSANHSGQKSSSMISFSDHSQVVGNLFLLKPVSAVASLTAGA
jgi:hypothetical protein